MKESAPPQDRRWFDHDGDSEPRPHGNCYWLARGRILAGEYPRTANAESSRAKLAGILDANVRRFIDLTECREGLEPYEPIIAEMATSRGIEVVHARHAIQDLGVPSAARMRAIVDALLSQDDGVTYLHCWGGVGRTGTVAGCLLVEAGYSGQEAIDLIARKWRAMDKRGRQPQSPETEAQFEFIRKWRPRTATGSIGAPKGVGQGVDTLVVFSHGKESGPQGTKIKALMRVAESEGARAISIDYREYPAGVIHDHDLPGEAGRRVRQLLSTPLPPARRVVLVGSSMGGYVSTVAASSLRIEGLFLLAPAFYMPGYEVADLPLGAPRIAIVHGWGDDVVPWRNSARFAEKHRSALHLVDSDHRLDGVLPAIESLFRMFLRGAMQSFVTEPAAQLSATRPGRDP